MRVVGILLVSLLLSIPGMGQKKKDAAKEFEGTIKYSISAEGIEGLEDALAMMPANMLRSISTSISPLLFLS